MAREVLSNGVINPDKYQADWYADLSNNWNLLDNLIGSAISGSEVDSKIATAIQELMIRTFQIVAELPATGTEGVMYLVLIPDTSKYTAYVWENNAYRELGVIQMTITVDDELSTTSENPAQNKVITNALNNKAPISHTHSASDITSGLATVATSGNYNDLSNKPTIPSKTSDLTNDSGFITSDNTKIPLAGSNQISGSLIPSSDGTVNLGGSNYFFKNTYSKTMYVDTLISLDNTCGIVFGTSEQSKQFRPRSTDNNAISLGIAPVRWKEIWCTQSSINSSSDERQKQQIKPIDNDLLDAWENVNPIEFKWNDAVKEKGDNARVHTGYIAQNIQQALTENGVNPNDYGLFLYDEWGEEQEEKDEQGNIIKPYRPSGNAYGLRYTEVLIVECAYLRKKLKELTARIEQLESSK